MVGVVIYSDVSYSYALGDVTATVNNAGGLVGNIYGYSITGSYSTGTVTAPSRAGGLMGYLQIGTISNSGWWTGSAAGPIGSGGTVTYNQSAKSDFYGSGPAGLYSTWDFNTIWAIDASKNNGYPYLQWQTFPEPEPEAPGGGYGAATPIHTPVPKLPNTGVAPQEKSTPWNIVLLVGVFTIISTSLIIIRKKQKLSGTLPAGARFWR